MYSVHKYVNAALGELKICWNIHESLSALSTRIARKVINLLADGWPHFHSWVKIGEGASVCLDRSALAFLTRRSPQLPALLSSADSGRSGRRRDSLCKLPTTSQGLEAMCHHLACFLKPSCSRTGSRLCVSR